MAGCNGEHRRRSKHPLSRANARIRRSDVRGEKLSRRLITRRSQVQILPPPPFEALDRMILARASTVVSRVLPFFYRLFVLFRFIVYMLAPVGE